MSAHDPLTYPDLRHLLSKLEHEDPAAQPRPLWILTDSPGRPEAEGIPFPREKEARTYVERQMIHDTQPRAVRRPQQLPRNRNAISEAEARPAGREEPGGGTDTFPGGWTRPSVSALTGQDASCRLTVAPLYLIVTVRQ